MFNNKIIKSFIMLFQSFVLFKALYKLHMQLRCCSICPQLIGSLGLWGIVCGTIAFYGSVIFTCN